MLPVHRAYRNYESLILKTALSKVCLHKCRVRDVYGTYYEFMELLEALLEFAAPGRTSQGGAAAWGFSGTQSANAGVGGLVHAEPSWGSTDPSFTSPYFSWENSCAMIPGSGSKEKLAGPRLQIS